MKKYLLVLSLVTWAMAGLLFAQANAAKTETKSTGKASAIEATILALEKESWEAPKRHDAAAFANLCREDEWEIFGNGELLTAKEVIAQIPDTEILEYKMEEPKVFVINDHTAIIRYKIWAKTSYKGQVSPAQWMLASAVWIKEGNSWKAAMYQETPLPKN